MSNVPQGDIEIVYPSCPPLLKHQKRHRKSESTVNVNARSPSMRIRLCRERQTVEIARFVSAKGPEAPDGGEWTKKVLSVVDGRTNIRNTDWCSLLDVEKAGIEDLHKFVRTCEAVEKQEDGDAWLEQTLRQDIVTPDASGKSCGLRSGSRSTSPLQARDPNRDWEARSQPNDQGASWGTSAAATNGLSAFHVAPRPTKLSNILLRHTAVNGIGDRSNIRSQAPSADLNKTPPQHVTQPNGVSSRQRQSDEEYSDRRPAARFRTRFIPSVGWCIRYGSRVSQGGRYRVMFLDGLAMEVDVDEESGDFTR
jgi:polo-like kinase 4